MSYLTENQRMFLLSLLNSDRQKTNWVIENKPLNSEKKQVLKNKVQKITEIIIVLEKPVETEAPLLNWLKGLSRLF